MINWEAVAKWRDELRSGKYEQGRNCLRSVSNKYCCLGVFVEGVSNEKVTDADGGNFLYDGDASAVLTKQSQAFLGSVHSNPRIFGYGAYILNDVEGLTFDEIADLLDIAILEHEAGTPDEELIQ